MPERDEEPEMVAHRRLPPARENNHQEEMVERVARAIAGGEWREPPFNDLHTDAMNNGWRYKARRAIEAMREPTEIMAHYGRNAISQGDRLRVRRDKAVDVYQAMITRALGAT